MISLDGMSPIKFPSRRGFIKQTGILCNPLVYQLPIGIKAISAGLSASDTKAIKIGMVADAHADLIPDKDERLTKFISSVNQNEADLIVQLGDFCFPKKENLDFLNIWNQYKGPKYHVLGNHDMDISSKQVIMDYLGMPDKYYSFDYETVHFVVLDANYLYTDGSYVDYDNANFYVDDFLRTFIDSAQIEWLKADLESTNLHTVVLSHQSLLNPRWGVKNRFEIQKLFEDENERVGFQKVIACFNGHDHIDFCRSINGIHYIELNSLSYYWMGQKYSDKSRWDKALYEQYQSLDKLAPYNEALYAMIQIDIANASISIQGTQSSWMSPSPKELNMPDQAYGSALSPSISDRTLAFKK